MMHALQKHCSKILKNNSGITAIEFALLSPILLLLLMGCLEIGLIIYISSVLEGATAFGARIGKTGFVPPGQTRADYIRSEVIRLTEGLVDEQRIMIRIVPISTWSDPGPPCPPPPNPCPVDAGRGGDIVLYEISYEWNFFTPLVGQFFPQPYLITAVTPVRNEEF